MEDYTELFVNIIAMIFCAAISVVLFVFLGLPALFVLACIIIFMYGLAYFPLIISLAFVYFIVTAFFS